MAKYIALFMAFYFMFGSLLPRTDFSQLWQLDELVEHYQMHKAEARPLMFLWAHLTNPDGHEHPGHSDEHQQLPLQSVGDGFSGLIDVVCIESPIFPPSWRSALALNPQVLVSADYFPRIFQPPVLG